MAGACRILAPAALAAAVAVQLGAVAMVLLGVHARSSPKRTEPGYHLLTGLGFDRSERACLRHQGGIATTTHLRTSGSLEWFPLVGLGSSCGGPHLLAGRVASTPAPRTILEEAIKRHKKVHESHVAQRWYGFCVSMDMDQSAPGSRTTDH